MNFKRLFFFFVIISLTMHQVFSKELNDSDCSVIMMLLDAKLDVENFEELEEKMDFMQEIQKKYEELKPSISEEAQLISRNLIVLEIESLKQVERIKKEEKQNRKSKKQEFYKNSENEKILMSCFEEYKNFLDTHEDLSSHFYFHYKEVEFATLPYLKTADQMKVLKDINEYYEKIEKMNPFFSENLLYLGMMFYMMPSIFGGNKTIAKEKLMLAIEKAACRYEKVSACTMLSQILFEEKEREAAVQYLDMAIAVSPENITLKLLKLQNEAGYSMFNPAK